MKQTIYEIAVGLVCGLVLLFPVYLIVLGVI